MFKEEVIYPFTQTFWENGWEVNTSYEANRTPTPNLDQYYRKNYIKSLTRINTTSLQNVTQWNLAIYKEIYIFKNQQYNKDTTSWLIEQGYLNIQKSVSLTTLIEYRRQTMWSSDICRKKNISRKMIWQNFTHIHNNFTN